MKIKYQLFLLESNELKEYHTDPFDTKEEAVKEIQERLGEWGIKSFVILEVYSEA